MKPLVEHFGWRLLSEHAVVERAHSASAMVVNALVGSAHAAAERTRSLTGDRAHARELGHHDRALTILPPCRLVSIQS